MSSNLTFKATPIEGLFIIERNLIKDNRGFFFRLFAGSELVSIGLKKSIAHINFSHTNDLHSTRGLHFQYPPHTETKIVTCLKGEVFDVAVDLRKDSPTFLNWFGINLSPENNRSFFIPDGFAHGFQVLKKDSELIYLHTNEYVKESEGGLHVLDPLIGIKWPYEPTKLSERDKGFIFLNNNFKGIEIL